MLGGDAGLELGVIFLAAGGDDAVAVALPVAHFLEGIGHAQGDDFCEIRLAACKLLDLPEMELASSYRWQATGIKIILYDGVSGGAGYCKKVHDLRLSQLLEYARDEIASCRADCSRSCSKCLRNYSNQTYREELRRRDALDWLNRTCLLKKDDPRISLGAERGGEEAGNSGLGEWEDFLQDIFSGAGIERNDEINDLIWPCGRYGVAGGGAGSSESVSARLGPTEFLAASHRWENLHGRKLSGRQAALRDLH